MSAGNLGQDQGAWLALQDVGAPLQDVSAALFALPPSKIFSNVSALVCLL